MLVTLSTASQMGSLLKNIRITPKAHVCWCYKTIEMEIQSTLFGAFQNGLQNPPW